MRLLFVATLIAAAAFPLNARASVSVAGGGLAQSNPAHSGAAVIVSTGASVPQVPLEVQSSLLASVNGQGGFAATAEIRGFTGGGYGGAYVGAGAGLANLSSDRSTGTVFDVFAGKSIAPVASLELRLYKQTRDNGFTSGFFGLRFTF